MGAIRNLLALPFAPGITLALSKNTPPPTLPVSAPPPPSVRISVKGNITPLVLIALKSNSEVSITGVPPEAKAKVCVAPTDLKLEASLPSHLKVISSEAFTVRREACAFRWKDVSESIVELPANVDVKPVPFISKLFPALPTADKSFCLYYS